MAPQPQGIYETCLVRDEQWPAEIKVEVEVGAYTRSCLHGRSLEDNHILVHTKFNIPNLKCIFHCHVPRDPFQVSL